MLDIGRKNKGSFVVDQDSVSFFREPNPVLVVGPRLDPNTGPYHRLGPDPVSHPLCQRSLFIVYSLHINEKDLFFLKGLFTAFTWDSTDPGFVYILTLQ